MKGVQLPAIRSLTNEYYSLVYFNSILSPSVGYAMTIFIMRARTICLKKHVAVFGDDECWDNATSAV